MSANGAKAVSDQHETAGDQPRDRVCVSGAACEVSVRHGFACGHQGLDPRNPHPRRTQQFASWEVGYIAGIRNVRRNLELVVESVVL